MLACMCMTHAVRSQGKSSEVYLLLESYLLAYDNPDKKYYCRRQGEVEQWATSDTAD